MNYLLGPCFFVLSMVNNSANSCWFYIFGHCIVITQLSTGEMKYALSSEITLNLLHINGIRFQPSRCSTLSLLQVTPPGRPSLVWRSVSKADRKWPAKIQSLLQRHLPSDATWVFFRTKSNSPTYSLRIIKAVFFFSGVIRVNREYGEMATLIISVKLSLPSFMLVSGQRYSVVWACEIHNLNANLSFLSHYFEVD